MPQTLRRIQTVLAALLLSVALMQPSLADDRDKRIEIALDVIRTTDNEKVVRTVVDALTQQIKELMVQAHPGRKELIEQVLSDGVTQIVDRRGELHAQIAAVYADEFTVAELQQLLQFYRGPLGQKFLTKMPLVTQKTIVLGQKWGRSVASDIIESIQTEIAK